MANNNNINNGNGKSYGNKAMINDPRSPTNEYNRTPIHCNSTTGAAAASNQQNIDDFGNESSSSSLDSSSLINSSDLSGLYQTGTSFIFILG